MFRAPDSGCRLEAETQRAVDDVVDAAEAAVGTVPERGAAGVSRAEIQRMQVWNGHALRGLHSWGVRYRHCNNAMAVPALHIHTVSGQC